jgi:integrase
MPQVLSFEPPVVAEASPATRRGPKLCQTLRVLIGLYLPQAKRENADKFYKHKVKVLGSLDSALGTVPIEELRTYDLQMWLNTKDGLKAERSIRCVIAIVKRCLNWGVDSELITRNPFARFRSRGKIVKTRRTLKPEQWRLMLIHSAPFFRRFLTFLRVTGCRPGEARSMKWSDVSFEDNCVTLLEHKTARATGKPRIVHLSPVALKLLWYLRRHRQVAIIELVEKLLLKGPVNARDFARLMKAYGVTYHGVACARRRLGVVRELDQAGYFQYRLPPWHCPRGRKAELDDYVFLGSYGRMTSSSTRCYMRRMREKCPKLRGVTLYALRHLFGLTGIKHNVNLKIMSLLMGHADVRMTEHYIDESSLKAEICAGAIKVNHGEGAYGIGVKVVKPAAVAVPMLPGVDEIRPSLERLPQRNSQAPAYPALPAGLLDDFGPDSPLQKKLRDMIGRKPGDVRHRWRKSYDGVAAAMGWALQCAPELRFAKIRIIHDWLLAQPDCPVDFPRNFLTFRKGVSMIRGIERQQVAN